MKSPVLPLFIAFLFLFTVSFSQVSKNALLQFQGYIRTLGFSKTGQPLCMTNSGQIKNKPGWFLGGAEIIKYPVQELYKAAEISPGIYFACI